MSRWDHFEKVDWRETGTIIALHSILINSDKPLAQAKT